MYVCADHSPSLFSGSSNCDIFMYICMYVYMYAYMYVRITLPFSLWASRICDVCKYVCMHACMYGSLLVFGGHQESVMYVNMYVRILHSFLFLHHVTVIYVCICICMHAIMNACICVAACIPTYIHTHTHYLRKADLR